MQAVWASALTILTEMLTEKELKLWIHPLRPLQLEPKTLALGCPNKFFLSWVKEKYLPRIQGAVRGAAEKRTDLETGLDIKLELDPVEAQPARPAPAAQAYQYELPHINVYQQTPLRFNQRFTFDRFVVGQGNHFAYSVSVAMASEPDLNTSALMLLSAPGLGKSHLSQAIGHHILSGDPKKRVFYLTAEDFTNEMVYSIKNNRLETFKNKYRSACDVLVLEEINFLAGKEKIQTELAFTLDRLMENRRKIVFTSTQPPKDIPKLKRKLLSRFNTSIMTTIAPPDFDTRLRILKSKAEEHGLRLKDNVLALMAQRLTQDVRQMESCLCSLAAKSRLLARRIDLELAEEVMRDLVEARPGSSVDLDAVLELICRYYGVSADELRSRSRRKNVCEPRKVGIFLLRETTDMSLSDIGKVFDRNHSTVVHALNTFQQSCQKDVKLKGQVDFLKKQLESQRA